jgi:uncharacterized protein
MLPFEKAKGFDWDAGNLLKVWDSHKVRPSECEEVFGNAPFGGTPTTKHETAEDRHIVYGNTNEGRLLTVVYTMRGDLIRVISPRPMSQKERKEYAEAIASHS